MSTYYEYKDVGVMIAHKLMNMEGWKVYGYKEDESDSMTDYYSPANWGGVAEKNGYILCVNVYGARGQQEIRKYNYNNFTYNRDIQEKIIKLEAMTVNRGASEQEEESAKVMIKRLQEKAEVEQENSEKYIVTGVIPGHMAHPPRMNWHIEKDGVYIAKGNGILKYADVNDYYNYSQCKKDMKDFKEKSKAEYLKDEIKRLSYYNSYKSQEWLEEVAEGNYTHMLEKSKLIDQFEKFINKLDTACGCLVGDGELEQYETIKITEYKKENKVVETTTGSIKEGQCFVLKSSFNYGRSKGLIYRIHRTEYDGKEHFHAYKLNRKLTKECTGRADQANHWSYISDDFIKWIDKGAISWCEIQEVKTPYEVEKVVKKVIKAGNAKINNTNNEINTNTKDIDINNLTFDIKEDIDTRDNSQVYIVKVKERLEFDDYIKVNKHMKKLGGYYSKFKKGFLFKIDPRELLTA